MSGLKKTDSFNWLLIEWKSGCRNVVHVKSVISPLDEELRPGNVIKLNWRGEQKTATFVAHARDRDLLVKDKAKAEAGPNCKSEASSSRTYEEAEDYSCSETSWVPSDDEEMSSADSDTVDTAVKPKMREKTYKTPTAVRNYSKRRHTSLTKIMSTGNLLPDMTKITPLPGNTPVKPKMREQKYNTPTAVRNYSKRRHTSLTKIMSTGNLLPDMTKITPLPEDTPVKPKMREQTYNTPTAVRNYSKRRHTSLTKIMSTGNLMPDMNKITPLQGDTLVKPKMREQTYNIPPAVRNYSKRLHTSLTKTMSTVNLLPDMTKWQNEEELQNDEEVLVKVNEINDAFKNIFNIMGDIKRQIAKKQNSKEHVENLLKAESSETPNEQSVYEYEEDNSDELNRSEDNVLITNKYNFAERNERVEDEWIPIGSGKTLIHKDKFKRVNWKSFTLATRTLLLALFPRRTLATHSLTGKQSPAFKEKHAKMCLDPKIISDVIIEITERFNVKDNVVRKIITNKCADECKMYKTRTTKRKYQNDENVPPATNNKLNKENENQYKRIRF